MFGETAGEVQTFTVPIVDDNTVEGPETFTVLLGNLGGTTASVDITDTATVTITDNDEPPPPAQKKTATVSFRDSLSASASIRTHLAEGDGDTCQYLAYHVVFDPPIPNARAVYGVGPGVLARYRPIPHERAVSKYSGVLPPSAYYVLFDPPVPHWFKFRFGAGGPLDSATPPEDYHFCNPPNIRPVFEVRDRHLFSSRHLLAIRIVDDAVDDDDEFLTLNIKNLPDALGYTAVAATLTITDNDEPPPPATVTLGNEEVDEDAGTVTVTATVDVAVPGGFTVDVMTTDGTAEAPGDYTTPTGQTLSFGGTTAGETQTFTVPIVDDNTVEGPETFTVLLGNRGGTTASVDITDTATITIIDNDEPPPAQEKTATVSFRDSLSASASIRTHLAEGDGDTCQYLAYHVVFDPPIPNARAEYSRWPLNAYQVLFDPPVPHWFKFRFWSDGPLDTATPPEDYHFCSPPNIRPVFEIRDRHLFSSRHLLAIRIVDDAVDDDDEFLTLGINNLPDALGYTVVAATLTITDNDEPPPPTVTLGNETVDEDAGTVTVTATVDVAVPGGFTVDVMTTDGTAEAPGDYTRPTGQTLSFGGDGGGGADVHGADRGRQHGRGA